MVVVVVVVVVVAVVVVIIVVTRAETRQMHFFAWQNASTRRAPSTMVFGKSES